MWVNGSVIVPRGSESRHKVRTPESRVSAQQIISGNANQIFQIKLLITFIFYSIHSICLFTSHQYCWIYPIILPNPYKENRLAHVDNNFMYSKSGANQHLIDNSGIDDVAHHHTSSHEIGLFTRISSI